MFWASTDCRRWYSMRTRASRSALTTPLQKAIVNVHGKGKDEAHRKIILPWVGRSLEPCVQSPRGSMG